MKIRRLTDTGEWTTRRYLSLLGNILIWVIVVIDAFYLWPTQLHGSTSMVIVSGHSMEPTYFTGDLVIARKMTPSVGDVIVYAPDGFGGSQIVHRIIGGNAVDGWVMQGDNNPNVDPFTPKGAEIRGVVLVHYANFGRVTVLLLNPIVWALVLLAAVVLLVWWSGDTCDDDPDDKDNDERADGGDPESEPDEEPDLIDRMVEGTEAAIARMVSSGADAGAAVLAMLTRPSPVPRHAARAPRYRAPAYLRVSAIVAVVGLASVFGLSPASASSLTITTKGNIFTHTYTPCTTATLRADPATRTTGTYYTQLVVSAIPQLCNGKPITMFAYDAAGKLLMSSTLSTSSDPEGKTGTSGTVTFTKNTGSYSAASVSKVLVFIDTWGIQTTWTYTPPVTGPYSCVPADNVPSALSVGTCVPDRVPHQNWGEWGDNRHHVMTTYLHVDVAAGTANAIVTLDLSQAPFPTWTVRAIMGNLDWIPVPGYSCSELPIVRLYANPGKGGVSKDIYLMLAEDANYFGTGAGQPARICPSG